MVRESASPYVVWSQKERGASISDESEEDSIGLGLTIVGVSGKHESAYLGYIRSALGRGATIVHLVAEGNAWIAKSHRITNDLVSNGTANVFRCEVGEEPGTPSCPFSVITLATPEIIPNTSKKNWAPDQIEYWESKASEHRTATTAVEPEPV